MKKFEKYSYLLLVVYLLLGTAGLWISGYLLNWNPQATVMLSAKLTALPFLAWIILTAYYSVRWLVRRKFSSKHATKPAEKRM